MTVHEVEQRPKSISTDDRIGIQEENVVRFVRCGESGTNHCIVATGEAKVGLQHSKPRPRRPAIAVNRLLNAARSVAATPILANGDPCARNTRDLSSDGVEAIDRKLGDAIIDDDNEKFQSRAPGHFDIERELMRYYSTSCFLLH